MSVIDSHVRSLQWLEHGVGDERKTEVVNYMVTAVNRVVGASTYVASTCPGIVLMCLKRKGKDCYRRVLH